MGGSPLSRSRQAKGNWGKGQALFHTLPVGLQRPTWGEGSERSAFGGERQKHQKRSFWFSMSSDWCTSHGQTAAAPTTRKERKPFCCCLFCLWLSAKKRGLPRFLRSGSLPFYAMRQFASWQWMRSAWLLAMPPASIQGALHKPPSVAMRAPLVVGQWSMSMAADCGMDGRMSAIPQSKPP